MIKKYFLAITLIASALFVASCSNWDDHYENVGVSTGNVDIYNGDIVGYIQSDSELSAMAQLYQSTGVLANTSASGNYTFIVVPNGVYDAQKSNIKDANAYAKFTVSDASIAPSLLTDGYGIPTRLGKSLWVSSDGANAKIQDLNITKTVKTNNGYIYFVDGILPIRQSIYEYFESLPDDQYSEFKALVKSFEEKWFDREASRVIGVNSEGMTVYDSVFVNRNTLMDRYTENGVATWNMRDESYNSTMFIPTNQQIEDAVRSALDSIPAWLNRKATEVDELKFKTWIVRACFADRRLNDTDVAANAKQFACVGDCQMVEDHLNDLTTYKTIEPAYWRPSINTVDVSSKVELSNGVAYYTTNLHIPNHVVIYRVKTRFYQVWSVIQNDKAAQAKYFKWTNWQNPSIVTEAQGAFTLAGTTNMPTIYYNVLTAEPTEEAHEDNLLCSVEYSGLTYDENNDAVYEVNLPAGEYYLRMGFKHSLTYSLSIYFKGEDDPDSEYQTMVEDMVMYATGSNFHFDRGAASEVPHYGDAGISYPEGFDVDYWQTLDPKAIAYDTDGYTVGIVNLKKNGNFKIKVSSSDLARLYSYKIGDQTARTKSNVQQLMMYHWCLRPTINNY